MHNNEDNDDSNPPPLTGAPREGVLSATSSDNSEIKIQVMENDEDEIEAESIDVNEPPGGDNSDGQDETDKGHFEKSKSRQSQDSQGENEDLDKPKSEDAIPEEEDSTPTNQEESQIGQTVSNPGLLQPESGLQDKSSLPDVDNDSNKESVTGQASKEQQEDETPKLDQEQLETQENSLKDEQQREPEPSKRQSVVPEVKTKNVGYRRFKSQGAITPLECSNTNAMLDACDTDVTCQMNKITIGEPEREQLKAAGLHILEIGQKLLNEMNFVEGLLTKFGALVSGENKNTAYQSPRNSRGEKELCLSDEKQLSSIMQMQTYIATQGQRRSFVSWEDKGKTANDDKNAEKAIAFGSGFQSPRLSSTMVQDTAAGQAQSRGSVDANTNTPSSNANYDQDFRKRIAKLEIKVECMNSKLEVCGKQVTDVYNTLCASLNKLSEETSFLREKICEDGEQGAKIRNAIDDKISCFEQQIARLAQLLYDLKCETQAQMHFGQIGV